MHKTALNTVFALLVLASLVLNGCNNPKTNSTAVDSKLGDRALMPKTSSSPKAKQTRKDWYELIHGGDAVDWRSIEHQNLIDKRKALSESQLNKELGFVEIADGKLIGRWQELGPTNLAGDIRRVTYSEKEDRLYAISAGRTLWKGKIDGSQWEVVNDNERFDYDILKVVAFNDTIDLIFASNGGSLVYSEDGNIWSEADGFGSNAKVKDLFVLESGIFIVAKINNGSIKLFKAKTEQDGNFKITDYEKVYDFATTNLNDVAIATNAEETNLYGVRYDWNNKKIYSYYLNIATGNFIESDAFSTPIAGFYPEENQDAETKLYVSTRNIGGEILVKLTRVTRDGNSYFTEFTYPPEDFGDYWIANPVLPEEPWKEAYTILSDGQTHIMGRENCYYSVNGSSWELVNDWEEYYKNPKDNLHIDIMHVEEFERNGQKFTLLATHGGVYFTEDITKGVTNISLDGLQNAQFYDVVSIDVDDNWIFAGSQDQGWQRGRIQSDEPPIEFDQIISGDYGHMQIDEDLRMWISYPGGDVRLFNSVVAVYPDTIENPADARHVLERASEDVWISPLMLHPDPAFQKTVLVAGGSEVAEANGSYIVQLKALNNGEIEAQNLNENSPILQGEISAMAFDPFNINRWYLSTSTGKFYLSNDAGETWLLAYNNGPDANNLYGSDIFVSNLSPGTIYLAGVGYLNPGVIKSTNGGLTFTNFSNELPPTTVFELDANENESMIFAATEAGPYVYLKATNQWHDLSANMAPSQAFWSVDYIEDERIVRFGTYGRGVWQFEIDSFTANKNIASDQTDDVVIYPNPSTDHIRIQTEFFGNISHYEVLTLDGNFIFGSEITSLQDESIPVSQLAQGAYILRLRHKEGYIFKKFVKI